MFSRFTHSRVGILGGLLLLASSYGVMLSARAQETQTPRKLMYRVEPKYPEDLKRHDIGGAVRLSIEITPRGTVRKISPIGGNPVLVDAAVLAVKQWKYVPAETTDTQEVKVDFIPRQ
jgi:TonB family protein